MPNLDELADAIEDACEKIEKLEEEFEDQLEEMWLRTTTKLGEAQRTG